MGSNGVTVTKFLQFHNILGTVTEISYLFSLIYVVVTVTEVTKVTKFHTIVRIVTDTKLLRIPASY